ncbi:MULTISPECIES: hypothetical protein [Halomicrobium]|uniref:Uncharacterized protein n=1 Tax=Halomicrobium mukohataei (strain ATCC 700874 / DSM 12286 / JCM 9738 / NCIMB 13541) TaxID=485914 RepID=C7P3C1_HALMD|nr:MULTISPECIES: hypothetical protein [Halomicrobium]ACV47593.1 hypothetical protein Hmuk_1478 [Halomicrobium mukohataei DSM 12286]
MLSLVLTRQKTLSAIPAPILFAWIVAPDRFRADWILTELAENRFGRLAKTFFELL